MNRGEIQFVCEDILCDYRWRLEGLNATLAWRLWPRLRSYFVAHIIAEKNLFVACILLNRCEFHTMQKHKRNDVFNGDGRRSQRSREIFNVSNDLAFATYDSYVLLCLSFGLCDGLEFVFGCMLQRTLRVEKRVPVNTGYLNARLCISSYLSNNLSNFQNVFHMYNIWNYESSTFQIWYNFKNWKLMASFSHLVIYIYYFINVGIFRFIFTLVVSVRTRLVRS